MPLTTSTTIVRRAAPGAPSTPRATEGVPRKPGETRAAFSGQVGTSVERRGPSTRQNSTKCDVTTSPPERNRYEDRKHTCDKKGVRDHACRARLEAEAGGHRLGLRRA